MNNNQISIIVPVYNEEAGLHQFKLELCKVLEGIGQFNFKIIWVNDGSIDNSQSLIKQFINQGSFNISHTYIEFSRNFGHEAAMIAGIDYAEGMAIICLDSDLQHPPEKIPGMLEAFKHNNDIVMMVRENRRDNSMIKRWYSRIFYKLINKLSKFDFQNNASDFFLISGQVAGILKTNYRERNRFLRGYIQNIGFSRTSIGYVAPPRIHGETHYSYLKLLRLALDAVFSFSNRPLQLSAIVSLLFMLFTLGVGALSLITYFITDNIPSGYTTIIIFLSVCFTILFLLIAILSVYFGKSLDETRQRPIYIIKDINKAG